MNVTMTLPTNLEDYNAYIERMRRTEYPMLSGAIYLDHAGTMLYSKSLMEKFHAKMMANLYGNPHSASLSSQHSTKGIESARHQLLRFFNADSEHFDLVFTVNATAGIKLIGDAFRDCEHGFDYCYHIDSHTSLVGLRELARNHRCVESVGDLSEWVRDLDSSGQPRRYALLAYPLQSNMNGRRVPLDWCKEAIETKLESKVYTLVDAAAYVTTSPLDLSRATKAPDFTMVSLYKIFGFPDLGALIIKKTAGHIFAYRRYFGGGTVDMVACSKEQWHAKKAGALHEQLEDGTLPVHSIMAVEPAINTHAELFGTFEVISKHTASLAKRLYDGLCALNHGNLESVCTVYKHPDCNYGDTDTQGPTIGFNIRDSKGGWLSNAEVEKLASIRNIHLRTGGLCNPGGIATALDLAPWEIRDNFSAGHRCGSENDILNGKPTGMVRISLGAMSTGSDVERFLEFVKEFFVDETPKSLRRHSPNIEVDDGRFHVESLTVYPIKSCAGWQIPHDQSWDVRSEGLAWDREWCVTQRSNGKALSQKHYPRMALIRPFLDLRTGELRISLRDNAETIVIPLSRNPGLFESTLRPCDATVFGESIQAFIYASPTIEDFFTKVIGIPCTLARFNPASGVTRHSKVHLQLPGKQGQLLALPPPITLSNESPILAISRSSLNRLNEMIKAKGGKAALPAVFRPNIVLAENPLLQPGEEQPWVEDDWQCLRIGGTEGPVLEVLGGCRRCQMVCIDQECAERNAEPFVTLAKTRRFSGRVLFGVHTALRIEDARIATIKVGDIVDTFRTRSGVDV